MLYSTKYRFGCIAVLLLAIGQATSAEDGKAQGANAAPNQAVAPSIVAPNVEWKDKDALREMSEKARDSAATMKTQASVKALTFDHPEDVKRLSEEAKARGRAEMARLKEKGTLDAMQKQGESYANAKGSKVTPKADETIGIPDVEGRVFVALSSSMPEQMVRDYLEQLDGIPEGLVVLRGAVGGVQQIKPTMKWLARMRNNVPSCEKHCAHRNVQVIIDPLLYHALHIEQVPAIAYLDGVKDIGHCDEEQFKARTVIYGAVSVESALKAMSKEGVSIPRSVMSKFEKKGWEQKKS